MIRRALLALGGPGLGALWCFAGGLALGLAECPDNARSGLCAPARGPGERSRSRSSSAARVWPSRWLLSARNRRPYWLLGAVVVLGVAGLCTVGVLADQEPLPG